MKMFLKVLNNGIIHDVGVGEAMDVSLSVSSQLLLKIEIFELLENDL